MRSQPPDPDTPGGRPGSAPALRIDDPSLFVDRTLECMARQDLIAYQWQRLWPALARIGENNPFYRRKWDAARIDPRAVRDWTQFRGLPFTTKAELSQDQDAHPPFGSNLTYPLDRYIRVHQTSGTTGRPIRWLDTAESWDWWIRCWTFVYRAAGVGAASIGVRVTIHAGEPGASIAATRRRIEAAWGARCIDHTGLTEVGATGFTCAAGEVHLNESEFIVEVLDPVTGAAGASGEGELILTNLGREGSPVIRYRTGDRVRVLDARCACGRTFARLAGGILGRVDDMLVVRGMNVFPSVIEDVVRRFDCVDEFRLEVRRRAEMTDLRVVVEVDVL